MEIQSPRIKLKKKASPENSPPSAEDTKINTVAPLIERTIKKYFRNIFLCSSLPLDRLKENIQGNKYKMEKIPIKRSASMSVC